MFDTQIPLYGILIIVAIASGLLIVYRNSKLLISKNIEIVALLIYICLGAIFGAKYFSFIVNYQKYDGVFEFSKIGLSSYGAIIGILTMLYLFSKQYNKKFNDLVYILLPSIPLMYGVGKVGCFLAGCCFGIKYKGPFNVVYNYSYSAPYGVNLFPVQLLEAIVFVVIFLWSYIKVKKGKKVIGKTLVICGVAKFLLDYLRMSHVSQVLSINQIVSILFIIIGQFIVFKELK